MRKNLPDNIREHSNGESAFLYFAEKIQENGLYFLDEEIVDVKKWSELENVRAYYDFFKKHEQEFVE